MIIEDLFEVLFICQAVALYNACGILEWEGEFKDIPLGYFNCIIDNMYSSPTIDMDSVIVINLKRII